MDKTHRLYIIATFLLLPGILLAGNDERPFSDIPPDSGFSVPVKFLKEQRLVQGYTDGTFHPERPVSRAEALAMILKVTISKPPAEIEQEQNLNPETPIEIQLPQAATITVQNLSTGEKNTIINVKNIRIDVHDGSSTLSIVKRSGAKPFRDVLEKDWFYDIVREAKKLGIVKGYAGGKYFKPNDPVNLAETLRILFQSGGIQTDLTEAPLPPGIAPDAWFAKDITYAVSRTMLMQQENGAVFPPNAELTRGDMALLLYRFLQTKDDAAFGYASWYGDGLAKTKLTEGLEYKEKNLTAAHRTLPFGSIAHVTNMANGKSVDVVINDRGPFVTGRIIDLSKTAFGALESPTAGIISVQISPYVPPHTPGH